MAESKHKPIIETIINTGAIAVSATGVSLASQGEWKGVCFILIAAALEWFKYFGRHKQLW